jgi:PAS domain S-box-containing protein
MGADFFRAMATHLAKALSADCVLIGEFVGGPMEGVRSLGATLDGQPTSLEFELAGSAVAALATGKPCRCRSDATSRFPNDQLLPRVKAQALIAVPLYGPQKQVAGLIMVLYRRPVTSFHVANQLLEIFSDRAACELNRKKREDQLQESEQRYRAFIARSADAMWRIEFERPIDTNQPAEEQYAQIFQYGYLAECNDAMARLHGMEKAEQLVGCRIAEIAPESDPSMREAALLGIRAKYQYTTIETSPINRFGVRKHLLRSQWGIVEDGKLERIWGVSRDITQLRHSEQALDASEQRMADLLETVQLLVVIVDPEGVVVSCNKYLYGKTGWQPADVIGKDWLSLMVPTDEHEKLRATFERGAAMEGPLHYESTLLDPSGRRRQFEWDRTTLRDHEGHIAAWANIGRDVTDYRLLQSEFLQSQKLATIGRLAGGLAHDFNNLLTVVLGYSVALLTGRKESDPAYHPLTQIRKAAAKGAELTHRLLAFGRRQILRPVVRNLNTIVADAEHMIRHLIGDDIRFALELDPSLWRVRIDAGCFHQVLMNLAANSRDAMPHGGKLTIATANVSVEPCTPPSACPPPGDYVQITVTDTGAGLTDDAHAHLFEPFFTTKENGHGLGLPTVYGIVKQSGGYIFVDSAPGEGASFRIYFPRADGAEVKAEEDPPPADPQRGAETILLVEDRDDVRRFVSQTLRDLGYTVLEAAGPAAALEIVQDRSHMLHLLLTDVTMPDMDGFELADHVAAYREGVKVIFMSGFADAPHLASKIAAPGRAYLQKPFTPSVLGASVRKVLDD